MSDARLPKYVYRWGTGSLQPFTIPNANMWGFAFRSNMRALQGLCDRYLNQDPSGRVAYVPFAPFVMLAFTFLDHVSSQLDPFRKLGSAYETELAMWVPVRRRGCPVPMLFTPYILVNNPLAVVEGREIYGFPKEMAVLKKSRWPRQFPVDAYVIDTFTPDAVGHWGRLLSVDRIRRAPKHPREWGDFASAASELQQRLLHPGSGALGSVASRLMGDFWPPNAPMVLLKQFPDCNDGTLACYLSIVEADTHVTHLDYGAILNDDYVLRLKNRASHPISADLGLHDGDHPVLSYHMKLGFDLQQGREVWRAPTRSDGAPNASLASVLWDTVASAPQRLSEVALAPLQQLAEWLGAAPPRPAAKAAPPARRRSRRTGKREKIAVLGGGAGALAAAFALTEAENWDARYDITVYQIGWRLGGKGACGRNVARQDKRIEEHGIHAWFGYYENAFRMMRSCYRDLPELKDWPADRDPIEWGFEPHDFAVLEEDLGNGRWEHHPVTFPRNDERPGTAAVLALSPQDYITMIIRWMLSHLVFGDAAAGLADESEHAASAEADWVQAALHRLDELGAAAAAAVGHPANILSWALSFVEARDAEWGHFGGRDYSVFYDLLDRVMAWLGARIGDPEHAVGAARNLWITMDFGVTLVRGMLRDGVVFGDFDILNDWDFAEWLRHHGASEPVVRCQWIRGLYAMGFAFEGGDPNKPGAAAGTLLRGVLRLLLTYRGAFLYRMKTGMGDAIFSPLYRVLKARGVKFKFFHRVRELHLAGDGKSIERISIGRQADPRGPAYEPLIKVGDLWCWPNEPDYAQLEEKDQIEKLRAEGKYVNFESAWSAWGPDHEDELTLRAGVDFDRVILGISLGALAPICAELAERSPHWRAMLEGMATVRTQASQLWMKVKLQQTGWLWDSPFLTGWVRPIDTWGDMTHTLKTETWPADHQPQQIAYFCGVMRDSPEPPHYADDQFPVRMKQRVFDEMSALLTESIGHAWPAITGAKGLDWKVLIDLQERRGIERLRDQFWGANIDPSERYVLSLPKTIQYRLRADRSGFRNLCIAGDWTLNGVNAGCVEAAVMSGFRAARAIGGWPAAIVGEEHLD